jgi:TctA family transporter
MIRGFDFLVAVIGLFGISEILSSIEDGLSFKGQKAKIDLKVVLRTWAEMPRHWAIALRSPPSAAGWASRPPAPPRPPS